MRQTCVGVCLILAAWWCVDRALGERLDSSAESLDAIRETLAGYGTETTMIAWTHTTKSGAVLTIEVYRRDYRSAEEWLEAVAELQELYPPTPA